MAARTLPTAPSWSPNQEITSSLLNQISTYMTFWANPPSFRAEQHTTQSIAASTNTQVTLETVIHDSDTGLATTTPYSYVVPFAGIWDFAGGVGYPSNTSGVRYAMIYQNGTPVDGSSPATVPVSGFASVYDTNCPGLPCNVGDVISMWTYQNSGAALSTSTNTGQYSWFAGKLVSLNSP